MQTILDVLEKAIRAEIEGRNFYTMAAEATRDPQGREVFLRLADEERHHAEYLRAQWTALSETGKVDGTARLEDPVALTGSSPIFSASLRTRAATAHAEMTALSVGAQLEADAQRFYAGEARKAADPEVAAFLDRLAEWESGHYHALLAQMKDLEEDYWAANRFAPF